MNNFRLALIGCGLITAQSHLPAALSSPGLEVVALVDPVTERAKALAQEYGIRPVVAATIGELATKVDGAIIATPNSTHCEMALQCIAKGIHVLVEKPLAVSSDEGLKMVQAAESAGLTLAVGYSSRFRPCMDLLKELLSTGYFGRVIRFAHQAGTAGGWAPLSAYTLDRKTIGGGVLVVTGTHFLDRMLMLWGVPTRAELFHDGVTGPEANCTAVFEFGESASHIRGWARYSKTVQLPGGLVIETEHGVVQLLESDFSEVRFWDRRSPKLEQLIRSRHYVDGDTDEFRLQLADFVSACRSRLPVRVDGRQGLESLRLLETLYAHSRQLPNSWYLPE